jgi:hypothetical protein
MTSKGKAVDERGIRKYLQGSNPGVIELLFGKLDSKDCQSQLQLMISCCVIYCDVFRLLEKAVIGKLKITLRNIMSIQLICNTINIFNCLVTALPNAET